MSGNGDWRTESLRATAFLDDPEADAAGWEDLTGSLPETRTEEPGRGRRVEQGPFFHDARLVLERVGPQLNLSVARPLNAPDRAPTLVTIPTFEDGIDELRSVANPWLLGLPDVRRLAFGAVLTLPAETREDGYRHIDRYLPAVKVDQASRDFLYRINRRREVIFAGERILVNRLSTWSVGGLTELSVSERVQMHLGSTRYFGRLQLDVNTAPEWKEIPKGTERLELFELLIQLAKEIAQKGDVS